MSKFTALNNIAEKCELSLISATRWRQFDTRAAHDMVEYNNGLAMGYSQSYKIMKAELERLRNKFQNNCLTIDDFSTDDYKV